MVAAVSGLSTQPAHAAVNLPCNTAKLIVPWGAGGGTGVIFGIFEKTIAATNTPTKIKVVTIPGQGGGKGAKEAFKAKPDGCTLFTIHQHIIVNFINGVTDFNWDGFETVALLTGTPEIIGTGGHTPYKPLGDLLADAKKRPGRSRPAFPWARPATSCGSCSARRPAPTTNMCRSRVAPRAGSQVCLMALSTSAASIYCGGGTGTGWAVAGHEDDALAVAADAAEETAAGKLTE